jgi:hypothetical protein
MHEETIVGLDAEVLEVGDEAGERVHITTLSKTVPSRKLDSGACGLPPRPGRDVWSWSVGGLGIPRSKTDETMKWGSCRLGFHRLLTGSD